MPRRDHRTARPSRFAAKQPVTVKLHLVGPLSAVRQFPAKCPLHWLDEAGRDALWRSEFLGEHAENTYRARFDAASVAELDYGDFEKVFLNGKTEGRCYLIPVVATGGQYNQCSKILDFAKLCAIQGDGGWGIAKTKNADGGFDKYITGDITCGQDPYKAPWAKCHVTSLVKDAKSGM